MTDSDQFTTSKERGQSLTELALFMVFLLILVAGVVDIGRAFFVYIEMRDVAQEAALIAAIEGLDCSGVEIRVRTSTDSLPDLIDGGVVDLTCNPSDPSTASPGENITITATHEDFELAMPFLGTLLGGQTVDISASIIETVVAR
jgi:hypothetical protein